ncbi:uncharacterized protein LOC144658079 [Oculina patagonica]
MNSTFGETPPRRKRRRAPDDPIHKNVLVLRNGQYVEKRSDGVVLMPNTIEQAIIKKQEYGQFKKITLNVLMTESDVKTLLEKTFPFLTGQRFYCASVVDNRTRLDFHEEPRIWSGALINKNIKGNSALYIFSEENHSLGPVRLMEKLHISNASDTSDSGFETPAALCNNTREVLLPSSTSNKMPDPPPNVQVEYPMDEELNRTYNEYSSTDDLVIQEEFCASSYSKGSVPTPIWAEAIRSYKPGVQCVELMLIGQESAGKTSLGKDLKGNPFNKEEASADGVQMNSSIKNAGTQAWKNLPSQQHKSAFDHKFAEAIVKEAKETSTEQSPSEKTVKKANKEQMQELVVNENGMSHFCLI